ncbi:hypothetical protein XENORESO_005619, partial [Xenotaenia resolanae]
VPTSKTASLPQLWSPEMDRTNSGPQQSQSSVKKPSFNLSVFGNSSNWCHHSDSENHLATPHLVFPDAHFGNPFNIKQHTAELQPAWRFTFLPWENHVWRSSCSQELPQSSWYTISVRRLIKAKPAGAQPCGVTSATARRILQSLERMSSPLAMDSNLPPVQKLVVPAAASVSEHRSVSFRPTLTPGGLIRTLDRTPREKTVSSS